MMNYFPNCMQKAKGIKYQAYHENANKRLAHFIASKVIKAWRLHTRKIKNFKQKQIKRVQTE